MIDSELNTRPASFSKRVELAFWDFYVELLTRSKFMRGIFQFIVTFFLKTNLKNFIKLAFVAMLLGTLIGAIAAIGWNVYWFYQTL